MQESKHSLVCEWMTLLFDKVDDFFLRMVFNGFYVCSNNSYNQLEYLIMVLIIVFITQSLEAAAVEMLKRILFLHIKGKVFWSCLVWKFAWLGKVS